ncbi:putative NADH dehydrogenase [Beauveria bassiana]|nr:putative NADH dehydrogenase [Beauveria bassiana]
MADKERLIIIGSGWGGYHLAQGIDKSRYEVTVVSPENTSSITPLLASAACGLFDPQLAHEPIRRKGFDATYVQASVTDIDFAAFLVTCKPAFVQLEHERFTLSYDKIILAPGCCTNTFDIPGVEEHGLFVKSVSGAIAIRRRLNEALEMASLPGVSERRQRQLLHVVIVGGGPTGIELAAELTDLFDEDLGALYPHIRGKTSVSVHDVAPQILAPFDKRLSEYATEALAKDKVQIKVNSHILKVSENVIETLEDGPLDYGLLIWATGNKCIPLIKQLTVKKSSHGLLRVLTDQYLQIIDDQGSIIDNAYALGDAADIDGGTLPTTALVAVQKARYLVQHLNSTSTSMPMPFQYQQRPLVTYTGRRDGVVQGKHEYTGPRAWLAWRAGNLFWIRSWRRRIVVCYTWVFNWIDGRQVAL